MSVALPLLTRRRLLLPALAAAHLGLVAAATAGRPAMVVEPPRAMATFEVVTSQPMPPAPAPVDIPVLSNIASPVVEIDADATAAPGGPCALTASIEAALRTNPEARAAIAAIPPSVRSLADAVTLWNTGWTVAATPALDAVRRAVTDTIRAAPLPCRDAQVSGPRLLYVGDEAHTTILAFGSGRWSWADLLT